MPQISVTSSAPDVVQQSARISPVCKILASSMRISCRPSGNCITKWAHPRCRREEEAHNKLSITLVGPHLRRRPQLPFRSTQHPWIVLCVNFVLLLSFVDEWLLFALRATGGGSCRFVATAAAEINTRNHAYSCRMTYEPSRRSHWQWKLIDYSIVTLAHLLIICVRANESDGVSKKKS